MVSILDKMFKVSILSYYSVFLFFHSIAVDNRIDKLQDEIPRRYHIMPQKLKPCHTHYFDMFDKNRSGKVPFVKAVFLSKLLK